MSQAEPHEQLDSHEAITFLALLKSIFSFHGRLNRVKFVIGHFMVNALLGLFFIFAIRLPVFLGLLLSPESSEWRVLAIFFYTVYVLALIAAVVALISVYVRRLHDIDRSGYMALLFFIPGICQFLFWLSAQWSLVTKTPDYVSFTSLTLAIWMIMVLIVLIAVPGTRGKNRYGDTPV